MPVMPGGKVANRDWIPIAMLSSEGGGDGAVHWQALGTTTVLMPNRSSFQVHVVRWPPAG